MKTTSKIIAGLVLGLAWMPLLKAETPETAAEIKRHEALAAAYGEKAAVQAALITEHEQMKAEALKHGMLNPKVGPSLDYRAMELHCDKLIRSAQDVKTELLEFEKYHNMRSAELQGQ